MVVELWTPPEVERLLAGLRQYLESEMEAGDLREVRAALSDLVSRIVLDVRTRQAEIGYRIYGGIKMALPRGFEPLLPA